MTTKLLGILASIALAALCAEVVGFLTRQGDLAIWEEGDPPNGNDA